MSIRSSDAGATWSEPKVEFELPGENIMSVSLLRLKSGEIMILYGHKYSMPGCPHLTHPTVRVSRDEFETWSEPVECIANPGYYVHNNDRMIQLSTGRIIFPVSRHDYMQAPGGRYGFAPGFAFTVYSDDNGKTWSQSVCYVFPQTGDGTGFQEPGIIELADGRLMMWIRTCQWYQYVTYSDDGGITWTPPAPRREFYSPVSPLSMRRNPFDNALYAVWANPAPRWGVCPKGSSWSRTPLVIARSRDEGRTWTDIMPLEIDPVRGYCYTAMLFIEPGKLLLAYCCGGADGHSVLQDMRISRVTLPDSVLFAMGDNGISSYRIPAVVRTAKSTLIVVCDARFADMADLSDMSGRIAIFCRRSTDNGKTWQSPFLLTPDIPEWAGANDPALLFDRDTGRVFCFYNLLYKKSDPRFAGPGAHRFMVQYSDDEGATWSDPRDVTDDITPKSFVCDGNTSHLNLTSGHGVQMADSTLVHTINWVWNKASLFGSSDHGETWRVIGTPYTPHDESKIEEMPDGSWLVNTRVYEKDGDVRWSHRTTDRGQTWESKPEPALPDGHCNAGFLRVGDTVWVSNITKCDGGRRNLVLHSSKDCGRTWSAPITVDDGAAAYSDLVDLGDGRIGILYEKGPYDVIVWHVIDTPKHTPAIAEFAKRRAKDY